MSLDDSDLPAAARTAARHDLDRQEGISTVTETFPAPARHGGNSTFVLEDIDRDADHVCQYWEVPSGRHLPDGSAYQFARAVWYAVDDLEEHEHTEYRVLSRDYDHPHPEQSGTYAVTLASSRWRAGRGTGDDYSAFYKYDLTLRPVDEDGSIQWGRTPDRSLSIKLRPQYEDLVQPDGSELTIPYGEGTYLTVQATWVEDVTETISLATRFLGSTLGYKLDVDDLATDSARFTKAEAHHRFSKSREQHVVQAVRKSAELLASNQADLDTRGQYRDGKWMECYLQTDAWEKLGFPRLNGEISLKVYYPDHPERLDYPMDQPKIEASLEGKIREYDEQKNEFVRRAVPLERWEEIHAVLEEILLSHLAWADVREQDLVADEFSDGPEADLVAFQMPADRRDWLEQHYRTLETPMYRLATSHRTDLVYDILAAIRDAPNDAAGLTYEQLVDQTGAAYSTVRKHVRRLCEAGGDEPGILERDRGAVTVVSWSAQFLEEIGQEVLDRIHPEESPDDREERAEERRQQREERDADQETDVNQEADADDQEESTRESTWRYFEDLDIGPSQLETALRDEYLEGYEVRVRVDQSPRFPQYPPG